MLIALKKCLALAGALLAAFAGSLWYLSANAQESLNRVDAAANLDLYKQMVTFSLSLNTQAAIFSAIAAACVAVAELISD
jgi:uncharacterized protein YdgA (DUF945 family)